METVQRLDLAQGELSSTRHTGTGALIAPANLTRTGVFAYRQPDGSTRRELRHPDEVFHPDSLASFAHAPVTILHPGRVDASNWKDHAVGHVADDVKRDGKFVAGSVVVADGDAIAQAKAGKREISCGYQCEIDPTPGTYDGEAYDVAQKKIRINHVAIGPKGWGRMGSDARLHLDGGVSGFDDETDAANRGAEAEEKMDARDEMIARRRAQSQTDGARSAAAASDPGSAEKADAYDDMLARRRARFRSDGSGPGGPDPADDARAVMIAARRGTTNHGDGR